MSLPPYVPPTEEEYTALHARLSGYIDAYSRLSQAVDVNPDLCHHQRALDKIEKMKERLHCLAVAINPY